MADEQKQEVPQFDIVRIYTKDVSLETPNVPEVFRSPWKPETKVDLDVKYSLIDKEENIFEVVLRVTVTTTLEDEKVAYLCEVNQAGLFHIANMPEQQLAHALNSYAPSLLFPYIRETITSLVMKASFPQFILAPINFDAIFIQRMQQEQAQSQAKEKTEE